MSAIFDNVAESYDASLPPLPEEYIQLIQTRFNLRGNDKVIDLGCGSGLLTFALARFSSEVHGLDSSKEMIRVARERDVKRRVQWICQHVEEFNLSYDLYKLIIAFESFHLFPNPEELVRNFSLSLKIDGYLAIGWCNYHWELPLRHIILQVFASNGIEWGEWGYQSCSNFAQLVHQYGIGLSPVVTETIETESSAIVSDIVSYLINIDKTAPLKEEIKKRISVELESGFKNFLSSDHIVGVSSYSIAYCKR